MEDYNLKKKDISGMTQSRSCADEGNADAKPTVLLIRHFFACVIVFKLILATATYQLYVMALFRKLKGLLCPERDGLCTPIEVHRVFKIGSLCMQFIAGLESEI